MKPMRFVHSEGHLDISYDDTGDHILTGGPDGDVRILEGFEDGDTISHCIGSVVSAIACKGSKFYVASDDNTIQAYTFKEGTPDGIVTRFTSPVTHMCLNKSGTKLAASSCDFTVKLVDIATSSQKCFQEHEAPVLSVALHPEETLIASSSCDGTVKVWKVDDQKVTKTITGLPKCNDFSSSITLCRLCWDHTGKYLVVPVDKEVRVYDSTSWELVFTLTDTSIKEIISIVCFSPCGKYLAGSCRDGSMLVWNFTSKQCILREKHEKQLTITGLVWNPKGNKELAFCDNSGSFGLLENAVPKELQSTTAQGSGDINSYEDLFDDDDDMMIEATNPVAGDQSEADDDDDMSHVTQKKHVLKIEDDENTRDTDIGSVQQGYAEDGDDESVIGQPVVKPAAKPVYIKGFEPTPMQGEFQPGSTPTYLEHRFMMWNSVGLITQYSTDEEQSINIEFHDTATHHALHVTNTLNHSMADLSQEAVVLACENDENCTSTLVCMHFASWDSCKEWSMPFPVAEEIKAVAIGDGWLAAATDMRQIRIFTIGGVQKEIFSIPGPVVAMAAHTNQLLITYHQGIGIPGDQCIGVKLHQVTGSKRKTIIEGVQLALSPKSTLVWIGFSAEGTPFTVDSLGIVRMLSRGFGNVWVQVANMKKHCKGKSDNYWVVGIHENPQQLRVVMCKGAKYPTILPRPTVTLLPFQLPLCELTTDKGNIEENYWKSSLFSHHFDWWTTQGYEIDETAKSRSAMPQQESLMKLFALACKGEREFRAVELCQMMPSQHTVQLAIKYATRLKLVSLASKLNDVARQKAEEEMLKAQQQQQVDEEEEEEEDWRGHIQSKYNHSDTEWGHTNGQAERRSAHAPRRKRVAEDEADNEADVSTDIYEELEEDAEEEEEKPAVRGPMLNMKPKKEKEHVLKPLSQTGIRRNPFKAASEKTPTAVKGTSVFDSMEKPKSGNKQTKLASPWDKPSAKSKPRKKGPMQTTLFANKSDAEETPASSVAAISEQSNNKPKKTGFQLWLDENKSDLEEEHPDLSAADLTVIAAKSFKSLPPDEKKGWQDKAKGNVEAQEDSKKRKRSESEEDSMKTSEKKLPKKDTNSRDKVKPLSDSTTNKLAGFAFNNS